MGGFLDDRQVPVKPATATSTATVSCAEEKYDSMTLPKLLIVVNDIPFFLSHRMPLAMAALAQGYEVAVAAPGHQAAAQIEQAGITFFDVPMPRNRGTLTREIRAVGTLYRVLSRFRPDVVHLVTAKPVIFGGLLCRFRRVPVLAAISGLGHVFADKGIKSRMARMGLLLGYRLSLKRRDTLAIFQNAANLATFQAAGIVSDRFVMIRGSGVNLADFDPTPPANGLPVVLLPARMIWTKGIGEFVEAARILRARGSGARFVLAGHNDPGNPASIDDSQLNAWNEEGVVEWIGYHADIAGLLRTTDLVVLPSYYPEGLPKTIVDAAAAGRAVVTTDVPGCRDAIVDGQTGLLCRARDAEDLAEKIEALLEDPARRLDMGRRARAFAEREYDIENVVKIHLDCYGNLIGQSASKSDE